MSYFLFLSIAEILVTLIMILLENTGTYVQLHILIADALTILCGMPWDQTGKPSNIIY